MERQNQERQTSSSSKNLGGQAGGQFRKPPEFNLLGETGRQESLPKGEMEDSMKSGLEFLNGSDLEQIKGSEFPPPVMKKPILQGKQPFPNPSKPVMQLKVLGNAIGGFYSDLTNPQYRSACFRTEEEAEAFEVFLMGLNTEELLTVMNDETALNRIRDRFDHHQRRKLRKDHKASGARARRGNEQKETDSRSRFRSRSRNKKRNQGKREKDRSPGGDLGFNPQQEPRKSGMIPDLGFAPAPLIDSSSLESKNNSNQLGHEGTGRTSMEGVTFTVNQPEDFTWIEEEFQDKEYEAYVGLDSNAKHVQAASEIGQDEKLHAGSQVKGSGQASTASKSLPKFQGMLKRWLAGLLKSHKHLTGQELLSAFAKDTSFRTNFKGRSNKPEQKFKAVLRQLRNAGEIVSNHNQFKEKASFGFPGVELPAAPGQKSKGTPEIKHYLHWVWQNYLKKPAKPFGPVQCAQTMIRILENNEPSSPLGQNIKEVRETLKGHFNTESAVEYYKANCVRAGGEHEQVMTSRTPDLILNELQSPQSLVRDKIGRNYSVLRMQLRTNVATHYVFLKQVIEKNEKMAQVHHPTGLNHTHILGLDKKNREKQKGVPGQGKGSSPNFHQRLAEVIDQYLEKCKAFIQEEEADQKASSSQSEENMIRRKELMKAMNLGLFKVNQEYLALGQNIMSTPASERTAQHYSFSDNTPDAKFNEPNRLPEIAGSIHTRVKMVFTKFNYLSQDLDKDPEPIPYSGTPIHTPEGTPPHRPRYTAEFRKFGQ